MSELTKEYIGKEFGIGDPTKADPDWPRDPEAVRVLETGEYLLPDECAVKMNRAACELQSAWEEIERLKGENETLKGYFPKGAFEKSRGYEVVNEKDLAQLSKPQYEDGAGGYYDLFPGGLYQ